MMDECHSLRYKAVNEVQTKGFELSAPESSSSQNNRYTTIFSVCLFFSKNSAAVYLLVDSLVSNVHEEIQSKHRSQWTAKNSNSVCQKKKRNYQKILYKYLFKPFTRKKCVWNTVSFSRENFFWYQSFPSSWQVA